MICQDEKISHSALPLGLIENKNNPVPIILFQLGLHNSLEMVILNAMLCNNDVSSFEVRLVHVTMSDLHK